MSDVTMPRLSDSMEEGTILKWLKASGDEVKRGEEIVEIETDKANMTYEADASGVLEIVAAEGTTLPIGEPIATIGGGGAFGSSFAGRSVSCDASACSQVIVCPVYAAIRPRIAASVLWAIHRPSFFGSPFRTAAKSSSSSPPAAAAKASASRVSTEGK